jgi:hypothetical protein
LSVNSQAATCGTGGFNAAATSARHARGMDKIAQRLKRCLWISGRSTRSEWWLVHFLATIVATPERQQGLVE